MSQDHNPTSTPDNPLGWNPPSPEKLSTLLPQYAIDGILGRGAMGAVYRGKQIALDRRVAIKILPAELTLDQDFVSRFQREARTLAKLQHPGIIAVHDSGQTSEGHLYFVMEYVDGLDLHQLIHHHALDPAVATKVVAQVADALNYAHQQGVIHRDIKPANIIVTHDGRAKLADFGLARPISEDTILKGGKAVIWGTPDYMAPEHIEGNTDYRSDIYALGVVFYEALARQTPAKDHWIAPSEIANSDKRFDQVISRCLQAQPEKRYQEAWKIKRDIEQILSPPTAALKNPAAPAQARQPAQRVAPLMAAPTKPSAAGMVFKLGIAAALVGLIFYAWNVIKRQDQAVAQQEQKLQQDASNKSKDPVTATTNAKPQAQPEKSASDVEKRARELAAEAQNDPVGEWEFEEKGIIRRKIFLPDNTCERWSSAKKSDESASYTWERNGDTVRIIKNGKQTSSAWKFRDANTLEYIEGSKETSNSAEPAIIKRAKDSWREPQEDGEEELAKKYSLEELQKLPVPTEEQLKPFIGEWIHSVTKIHRRLVTPNATSDLWKNGVSMNDKGWQQGIIKITKDDELCILLPSGCEVFKIISANECSMVQGYGAHFSITRATDYWHPEIKAYFEKQSDPIAVKLAELEAAHQKQMQEKVLNAYDATMTELGGKYIAALEKEQAAVAKSGNLDYALLFKAEMDRIAEKKDKDSGEDASTLPAKLLQLRGTYEQAATKHAATRDALISPLQEQYLKNLEAYQSTLTKESKIESALKVKAKIEEIKNNIANEKKSPADP